MQQIPMRILSISNTPHNPDQGSGYVVVGYVEGLRKRGHAVDAFGPSDYEIGLSRYGKRYQKMIAIAVFGLRQFRRRPYDLVEVWGGPSWLLAVLLRGLAPNTPIVHHSNGIEQHYTELKAQSATGPNENERWFQFDVSRLYDWGLQAASAIVTVSDYDLPFLRREGCVPEERLYAIDNPLPSSYLDRPLQLDRPQRVGFCGSWIPKKGIDTLRTDVTTFLRQYPGWTFSVVGVGDTDVRAQFPDDVQEQLEVIPFLKRGDLIDWYETLAIFTLPSIAESFGLVAAEAMACGAALVATPVGYAYGLTDEEEALILPESRSPHLRDALTRLADDTSFRRKIAQNGYYTVQNLRWDHAVDKLEAIYEGLAG